MLDYLTLRLDISHLDTEAVRKYVSEKPVIMKVTPATGEIEWSTPCRESTRSDSHQVTLKIGARDLEVCGSPARSMGLAHNVWGSYDIRECARAHIEVARKHLPFTVPVDLSLYRVTRTDLTENYDLRGKPEVMQALTWLRQTNGGRYKVDAKNAETVYWSLWSRMRSGKAYHKGSHLRYQLKKGQAVLSEQELVLADSLLRLELRLGGEWWRLSEKAWMDYEEKDFKEIHVKYFAGLIGEGIEVADMDNGLLANLEKVAPTEGQALAAYRTWAVIKSVGVQLTQESMPKRTWHRHRALLFAAGLAWADLAASNIVPFRRKRLVLGEPVTAWEQIGRAA